MLIWGIGFSTMLALTLHSFYTIAYLGNMSWIAVIFFAIFGIINLVFFFQKLYSFIVGDNPYAWFI